MNSFVKYSTGLLLAVGLTLSATRAVNAQGATIRDLGALQPVDYSTGLNVNSAGTVVGRVRLNDPVQGVIAHATLWAAPSYTLMDIHPLGITPTPTTSFAYALSNSGIVGGRVIYFDAFQTRLMDKPFVFNPATGVGTTIPYLNSGDNFGIVTGVNSAGHAVGYTGLLANGAVFPFNAFYYNGSTAVAIPTVGGAPTNNANDISENNEVVGGSDNESTSTRTSAYIWTPGGPLVELPKPAGALDAQAEAISNDGKYIAGEAGDLTGLGAPGSIKVVLWTKQAGGNYTVQTIGNLIANEDSTAGGVTTDATTGDPIVTGEGSLTSSSAHSFIWTPNGIPNISLSAGIHDLNSVTPIVGKDITTATNPGPKIAFNPTNLVAYITTSATDSLGNAHAVLITIPLAPANTANVSGTITLQSCVNSVQPITFEFRPTDGSAIFTRTATLSSTGAFTLSGIPRKSYNVWIKGFKWLAKVVPVDTTAGDVTGVTTTLLTGDANNDNAVTTADYLLLKASFGATPTDPNWNNGVADFNCDGVVSTADYLLLKANFGQVGAP